MIPVIGMRHVLMICLTSNKMALEGDYCLAERTLNVPVRLLPGDSAVATQAPVAVGIL